VRRLNCQRRAARLAVSNCPTANVVWIERLSFDAVRTRDKRIDFLFIEGDHFEEGVRRDLEEWSPFVISGGRAAFHDDRIFGAGWPKEVDAPVRVVNQLFRNDPSPDWRVAEEAHPLVIVERT
jgi:hypothetical protein